MKLSKLIRGDWGTNSCDAANAKGANSANCEPSLADLAELALARRQKPHRVQEPHLATSISQVGRRWGFSEEDITWALENAMTDPDSAARYWQAQLLTQQSPEAAVLENRRSAATIDNTASIARRDDPPLPACSLGDQKGVECGSCRNVQMELGPGPTGRRTFQWTCRKGHRILRAGYGLEDVLIASRECKDYDDRALPGLGVFH